MLAVSQNSKCPIRQVKRHKMPTINRREPNMLPWHWSLRHECWRIPEMSNIFARMTVTVPEIQDNVSSVIVVTCPIELLDEITQLVCNGRSYVCTRPTENSKIFSAKNTTTEEQHFRYSNSYVVEILTSQNHSITLTYIIFWTITGSSI